MDETEGGSPVVAGFRILSLLGRGGGGRVFDDVTFSGRVSVGAADFPRLESKGDVGLIFERRAHRVIALLPGPTKKGSPGCRFVLRSPGVLWEWSDAPGGIWHGRLNWDARPVALQPDDALGLYEEVLPVQIDRGASTSELDP